MTREYLYQHLKDKGCRLTPQRKIIMDLLLSHQEILMSADQLLTQARRVNPAINPTTIYRNLELLDDMGLIYALIDEDGIRQHKLICHEHHHHHILCTGCGKLAPIDYCPVAPSLEALIHESGFTLEDHNLELYGRCPDCQKKI